jgi:predicted dehydrogenase
MMVSIAVLGCGRIGRMHAANIAAHPRAMLEGVFDVDEQAARDVAGVLASNASTPPRTFLRVRKGRRRTYRHFDANPCRFHREGR